MNIANHFETWSSFIEEIPELESELLTVTNTIKPLYQQKNIYPIQKNIFRAFREVKYDQIQNVLIGMDPYHNTYKGVPSACGLSFVTENGYVNPSLRILQKALNINSPSEFKELMIKNNTLMLNVALTVEEGTPTSHLKYWNLFTRYLIHHLSTQKPNLNWILLGLEAQRLQSHIVSGNIKMGRHPAAFIYAGGNDYSELTNIFKDLNYI